MFFRHSSTVPLSMWPYPPSVCVLKPGRVPNVQAAVAHRFILYLVPMTSNLTGARSRARCLPVFAVPVEPAMFLY